MTAKVTRRNASADHGALALRRSARNSTAVPAPTPIMLVRSWPSANIPAPSISQITRWQGIGDATVLADTTLPTAGVAPG